MTVKEIKEIAREVYLEEERKKDDELRTSDDYRALQSDVLQTMHNGGDTIPADLIAPPIDTEVVKLLRRGYSKNHPNWPSERHKLIQKVKADLRAR